MDPVVKNGIKVYSEKSESVARLILLSNFQFKW